MKKFVLILSVLFFTNLLSSHVPVEGFEPSWCLKGNAIVAAGNIEVSAGNLGAMLGDEAGTITHLALVGTIDARDFRFMRDEMHLLEEIDMRNVSIVEYSGNEGTSAYSYYQANEIPTMAFYNDITIKGKVSLKSILLPLTLKSVGTAAFHGCSGINSLLIPSGVTTLADFAFASCAALTSVAFPNTLDYLGNGVFSNCHSLEEVVIPPLVTSIGFGAFDYCRSLVSFSLPQGIHSIGPFAFNGCNALESMELPYSVTFIGHNAFSNCSALSSLIVNNPVPVALSEHVFEGVNVNNCILNVPFGKKPIYSAAPVWQDFLNISELPKINHFTPVWTGNGNDHMNLNVIFAQVGGQDMESGDEIGVFDGDLCVGMISLSGPIVSNNPQTFGLILASKSDEGLQNGYTPGNPVTFRLWKKQSQSEYPARMVEFINPLNGQVTSPIPFTVGSTVFVRISWDNTAPVAQAGPDMVVDEWVRVTLDASASSDADGDELTFSWHAPAGVTLFDGETTQPWFTAPAVDADTDFTFTVSVSDGIAEPTTDQMTVKVRPRPKYFTRVWTGNGTDHMNINVVLARMDGTDLSAGDEIGVFDGAICVGAGILQYPLTQQQILSIVVSADDGSGNGYQPGNDITYRFYRKATGREVRRITAQYNTANPGWSSDGKFTVGSTSFVSLEGTAKEIQRLTLNTGWNIGSFQVMPANPDMKSVFQPLITEGKLRKVMDESGKVVEDWGIFGGWQNNIGNLSFTEGYKINVSSAATLEAEGFAAELPLQIALKSGWNIIGWPGRDLDARTAVQPLIDAGLLKKVMDESGKALEDWGVFGGWQNQIGSFRPGKGYKVNVLGNAILSVPTTPLVATRAITSVGSTTASVGGEVTSTGGLPVLERGICWNTTGYPTVEDSRASDGTGIGSFTGVLSGLLPLTTYYVRAYAINALGTTYGSAESFMTETNLGSFVDERDGRTYKTVKIGDQVWMAENLAWLPSVSPANEGSETDPYYYVYDYQGTDVAAAKLTDNYKTYGVLYNWPAAMEACPSGWHLPSDSEWTQLENYLIANGYNYDGTTTGNKIAKSLAASINWNTDSGTGVIGNNLSLNNKSGFTSLPGGFRDFSSGTFNTVGDLGFWWSITEYASSYAWYRTLLYFTAYMFRSNTDKAPGFSVRCVRDN